MQLCRQHRNAARALIDAHQPNEAWNHAGFSIEMCLKAAIMSRERMNRWPSTVERPDLWTHDLAYLAGLLGISHQRLDPRDPSAAAWKRCFEWQRGHGYSMDKLPMRFAEQMCEAAFGPGGVLVWLSNRFRLII
jgi:hypothetical protein